ncbi:MAG: hypothetical protein JW895_08930 [Thermoleophilaceae bacterium]|nr:hypothetical protein [Thermoleophilaceae bacterium]
MKTRIARWPVVGSAVAALSLAFTSVANAATELVGTFKLEAGHDTAGGVDGSYFRMVQPGGTIANGPFVANISSAADHDSYTFLSPGTDDGLKTGAYQPLANPAFDGVGNSLSARIIDPTPFFGINFSVSTNSTDPQTGHKNTPAPELSYDSKGNVSGDVSAFAASWNNQQFNQGAPKPDGSTPGLTSGPTGHYNPSTGAFEVNWASHIQGGPFNGFTGSWHLEGTFEAAN